MTKLSRVLAAVAASLFLAVLANPAEAMSRKQTMSKCTYDNDGRVTCMGGAVAQRESTRSRGRSSIDANGNVSVIGGRPAGCFKFPKTIGLYCGCASALYVGLENSSGYWNLARHWFSLPRAAPGPGMAVVRDGHVAIIIGGGPGAWELYDPNSGGGLTRIWIRPLFGKVVNPHGRRTAMLKAARSRL